MWVYGRYVYYDFMGILWGVVVGIRMVWVYGFGGGGGMCSLCCMSGMGCVCVSLWVVVMYMYVCVCVCMCMCVCVCVWVGLWWMGSLSVCMWMVRCIDGVGLYGTPSSNVWVGGGRAYK